MGFCAGAMYPTLMAKGNSLFPHIAGLTSAILGCALLLVSSAMMGFAGFLSVQVLTPLAVFFVILAFGVVWMVTKLLRHLAQLQPDAAVRRSGKVASRVTRGRAASIGLRHRPADRWKSRHTSALASSVAGLL